MPKNTTVSLRRFRTTQLPSEDRNPYLKESQTETGWRISTPPLGCCGNGAPHMEDNTPCCGRTGHHGSWICTRKHCGCCDDNQWSPGGRSTSFRNVHTHDALCQLEWHQVTATCVSVLLPPYWFRPVSFPSPSAMCPYGHMGGFSYLRPDNPRPYDKNQYLWSQDPTEVSRTTGRSLGVRHILRSPNFFLKPLESNMHVKHRFHILLFEGCRPIQGQKLLLDIYVVAYSRSST